MRTVAHCSIQPYIQLQDSLRRSGGNNEIIQILSSNFEISLKKASRVIKRVSVAADRRSGQSLFCQYFIYRFHTAGFVWTLTRSLDFRYSQLNYIAMIYYEYSFRHGCAKNRTLEPNYRFIAPKYYYHPLCVFSG